MMKIPTSIVKAAVKVNDEFQWKRSMIRGT